MTAEQEIEQILEQQQAAWNRGDAAAYSQGCDENISFTNILGQTQFGPEPFEEMHKRLFAGIFKGSQLTFYTRRLHFATPELAVADLTVELRAYPALPPGVQPPADGVLRTSLVQVFQLTVEGWRVLVYHNVDVK